MNGQEPIATRKLTISEAIEILRTASYTRAAYTTHTSVGNDGTYCHCGLGVLLKGAGWVEMPSCGWWTDHVRPRKFSSADDVSMVLGLPYQFCDQIMELSDTMKLVGPEIAARLVSNRWME